ncbi:MAG TPA: hypothetical protein DCM14_05880 [Clostridiales bacterium UBA8153]|nr:hypothetical protein [Clostridiales bacterium UBA8153]
MVNFADLDSQLLAQLLEDAAKLWLAHDGLWFQAVEAAFGMEVALRLDEEAMERFTVIEAQRIKQRWGLPAHAGLDGLAFALQRRLYAHINRQELSRPDRRTLILRMLECRVQTARQRKGMAPFPCRTVGVIEYREFARTIDAGITTACLACPPEGGADGCWCAWQFSVE